MRIFVLRIRFSGDEDDVFLYKNKLDLIKKCYSYFEDKICNLKYITKKELYEMSFSEM